MYPTHPYVAQQNARNYTRDRLRGAEAARAARQALTAAQLRRDQAVPRGRTTGSAASPTWWALVRRALAA